MHGQIAAVTAASLAIVGLVAVAVLLWGVTDIVRLPAWAWKRAGRSRLLFLALVVVLPVIGVVIYVFTVREPVATLAAGGKAASLTFEGAPGVRSAGMPGSRSPGTVSPLVGFAAFGAASPPIGYDPFGAASPPKGGLRTRSRTVEQAHPVFEKPAPASLAYRPAPPPPIVIAAEPTPKVPSGWKADPTGRHQFRFWDGVAWTESVADSGVRSTDPVSS